MEGVKAVFPEINMSCPVKKTIPFWEFSEKLPPFPFKKLTLIKLDTKQSSKIANISAFSDAICLSIVEFIIAKE